MQADRLTLANRLNSAVPGFYVMPYGGHWRTPLMLSGLAGVVHDRQSADGQQHNCGEDDQQWSLHRDLDGPPRPVHIKLSWFK
jgi:hypothetical protein